MNNDGTLSICWEEVWDALAHMDYFNIRLQNFKMIYFRLP